MSDTRIASDNTNLCVECGASLTTYVDDNHTVVREQGEINCCCGDFDSDGNYVDATCLNCCAQYHDGLQIWEGKSTGGGYYIVNPSF
jgi:hypothetical protein